MHIPRIKETQITRLRLDNRFLPPLNKFLMIPIRTPIPPIHRVFRPLTIVDFGLAAFDGSEVEIEDRLLRHPINDPVFGSGVVG